MKEDLWKVIPFKSIELLQLTGMPQHRVTLSK